MFAEYIVKWDLLPDGEPIRTHSSRLLPVRQHGVAAGLPIDGRLRPVEFGSARLWTAVGRRLHLWIDHSKEDTSLPDSSGVDSKEPLAITGLEGALAANH